MSITYGEIYEELYPKCGLDPIIVYALSRQSQQELVVYDLGCGYGRAIGEILKSTPSVFGIDTDAECLEVCRRRYPTVEFSEVIQRRWPAPNIVFFNFHVLNYLSIDQFKSYLKDLATNGMKHGRIYADFIDRKKIMPGTFTSKKYINHKYLFENSLTSDESANATFIEKIYENSNLLSVKTSKLYLWTVEQLLASFGSSAISFQCYEEMASNNAISTSICIEM